VNQAQAIAKLRKVIGDRLAYRIDKGALTGDEREAARQALTDATEAHIAAKAARDARFAELLAGDALYQDLKAKAQAANDAMEMARSLRMRRHITVGRDSGMFFSVEAEGDNWAEVVEKVCKTKAEA
jgi:hypothetical protein